MFLLNGIFDGLIFCAGGLYDVDEEVRAIRDIKIGERDGANAIFFGDGGIAFDGVGAVALGEGALGETNGGSDGGFRRLRSWGWRGFEGWGGRRGGIWVC